MSPSGWIRGSFCAPANGIYDHSSKVALIFWTQLMVSLPYPISNSQHQGCFQLYFFFPPPRPADPNGLHPIPEMPLQPALAFLTTFISFVQEGRFPRDKAFFSVCLPFPLRTTTATIFNPSSFPVENVSVSPHYESSAKAAIGILWVLWLTSVFFGCCFFF